MAIGSDVLDRRTHEMFYKQDWSKLTRELLAFAMWWAGNYAWGKPGADHLALGQTCEDVVQLVILKTLAGERRYDPDKGELLPWLKDQVKSIIDHLARSAGHRRESETLQEEAIGPPSNPEEGLLDEQARREADQRIEWLLRAVETKPELLDILMAILHGCEPKPRCLAGELRVSVREINNRIKRLRRLALTVGEDADEE